MKKWISGLILVTIAVFALSFGTAFAADSGPCGNNATWTLNESKVLIISGSGEMDNYSSAKDAPWYSYRNEIANVIINNGITSIGNFAFSGYEELTSVNIPNSVVSIGERAFSGCKNLVNVDLPGKLESIKNGAFMGTAIKKITIPKSLTSVESSISSANKLFGNCPNLKTVSFESGVTEIPTCLFEGCDGIESITIPNTVTKIGKYAFRNCTNLTTVNIPNSVISIEERAFSGCKNLVNVDLPGKLESIENGAFMGTAIKKVTIPKSLTYVESSISSANKLFGNCPNLKTINFESGVTEIPTCLFEGCDGIESITIPNTVTKIGKYAFRNCTNLTTVNIPNSVISIEERAFSGCSNLANVDLPGKLESIGNGAFVGTAIKKITIPKSLTSVESSVSSANKLFGNCPNLKTINFESGVTEILPCTFDGCDGIERMVIPSTVTKIGNYAFRNCENLVEIVVPDSIVEIGEKSFNGHSDDLVFRCNAGSYAETYAKENGIKVLPIGSIIIDPGTDEETDKNTTITLSLPKKTYAYTGKAISLNPNTKVTGSTGKVTYTYYTDSACKKKTGTSKSKGGASKTGAAPKTVGTYYVKATVAADKNYSGKTSSAVSFNIAYSLKKNTKVTLSKTTYEYTGKEIKPTVTVKYDSKKIKNKTDYTATYKNNKNAGTATVTVTGKGKYMDSVSTTFKITAKYKIVFNGNGSTKGSTKELQCTTDKSYKLTKNGFSRTGYTFDGWNTKKDGTGTSYKDKASVKNLSKTNGAKVTLYAQWKANTYKVSFKANGGKGSMSNMSCKYGTSKKLTANKFTKEGYTFKGWNTKSNGKGTTYKDKASVKNLTSKSGDTVKLYAQWKANTYKISFNANGGSGSTKGISCTYDKSSKLTANGFTRKGYTFNGWNTKKDGTGKDYKDKASVKNLTKNQGGTITLYAQWKGITYKIKFDKNNSSATGSMSTISATYGTNKTLSANKFALDNYILIGWSKTKSGNVDYQPGAKVKNLSSTKDATVTLYAVWGYTVHYDVNGGTGTIADQKVKKGAKVTLSAIDGLTKEGFAPDKWNTKKDGTGKSYAAGSNVSAFTPKSGKITLYAQWKEAGYLERIKSFLEDERWKPGVKYTNAFSDSQPGTYNKLGPSGLGQGCWGYVYDFVRYVSEDKYTHFYDGSEYYNPTDVKVGDVWHLTNHYFAVVEVISVSNDAVTIVVAQGGYGLSYPQTADKSEYTYVNNNGVWSYNNGEKTFINGWSYDYQ